MKSQYSSRKDDLANPILILAAGAMMSATLLAPGKSHAQPGPGATTQKMDAIIVLAHRAHDKSRETRIGGSAPYRLNIL